MDYEKIGQEILISARNRLYMAMPYMDVAFSVFDFEPTEEIGTIATDTQTVYYNGKWLAEMYKRSVNFSNRAYLHMVLHCILRHPFKASGRDPLLWDIACDAAVESIIDGLDAACLDGGDVPAKEHFYSLCRSRMKLLTAEGIYIYLKTEKLPDFEIKDLYRRFTVDDHGLWDPQNEDQEKQKNFEKQWQDISDKTQTGMETVFSERGTGGEGISEQLRVLARSDIDYRKFLLRFAAPKEIMHVDGDAFDYIYYSYGLSVYGNMPLVELPETKEENRIEDFVIAVDTSMSTNGELVKEFLACTYGILKSAESFTQRFNIHIMQCDDRVRTDVRISSTEELREYMEHFELSGGSTTDFRPVFERVEELRKSGEMSAMRGIIFFTDAMGIFPDKRPSYDAAFVMLEEPPMYVRIPPWAIKIILDETGFKRASESFQEDLQLLWDELPRL